jgi:NAD(P)-dependent dehydrogenase (short-subunit alcohol dehydrogenase family)
VYRTTSPRHRLDAPGTASSGLGEATARLLSTKGASVVLGARRVDRLQSLADELTSNGGKATALATDVTRYDDVKRLVEAAVQIPRSCSVRRGKSCERSHGRGPGSLR